MKKTSFSFGGIKPAAKRAAVVTSAFDDALETAAPQRKQPSNETAEAKDDAEVDPLDAFMSGISEKKSSAKPKPQVSW